MARTHAVAAVVKQTAGQERGCPSQPAPPLHRLGVQLLLDGVEQGTIEDRRVTAAMDLAPIGDLADVEPVLEQVGERPHPEAASADGAIISRSPFEDARSQTKG